MNFAIIAAGDGSRLAAEGVASPKPLLEVGGVPLIERLIGLAAENGARSVACIINEGASEVRHFLEDRHFAVPVHVLIKTTPSSLHSLHALMPVVGAGPFCLFTVDAVCRGAELRELLAFAGRQTDCDAIMAVTGFVNDEKPLYVRQDTAGRILSFDDAPPPPESGPVTVTGGIYIFFPATLPVIDDAVRGGTAHLRNALRLLLERGLAVKAFPFSRIVDVDDRSDIEAAEQLLADERREAVRAPLSEA
jgi:NDP-sugar pyrophosphorylase family protein